MQSLLFIKDPNIVGRAVLLGDNNNLMKIRPQKIQSLKTSIAAMIVASLGFFSSTAEAVITLGGSNVGDPYHDTVYSNPGTWYDATNPDITALDPFLQTKRDSDGSALITGYNADGSSNLGPGNADGLGANGYKELTLAEAGTLSYQGETSVAFYLDVNQTGTGSEQPYYEIHALEIYTSSAATFNYTNGVASGTDLEDVYKFSKDDNNQGVLRLTPDNTQGTSNWDVAMYVPLVNFDRDDDLTAAETYLHFVITYEDNSGSDIWSVSTAGPQIPEPSSALLISLAGLMGLLRRRR